MSRSGKVMITDPYETALSRLSDLIDQARKLLVVDANSAVLATASLDAKPSARMVFIQDIVPQGLLFFANKNSGKAQQINSNPQASLCFYWEPLREQVVIEGRVVAQADAVADRFWSQRLRESQLIAWASDQGSVAEKPGAVRRKLRSVRSAQGFNQTQRHPVWLAYRLVPDSIEFWPSSNQRTHERVRFSKDEQAQWNVQLLNP